MVYSEFINNIAQPEHTGSKDVQSASQSKVEEEKFNEQVISQENPALEAPPVKDVELKEEDPSSAKAGEDSLDDIQLEDDDAWNQDDLPLDDIDI